MNKGKPFTLQLFVIGGFIAFFYMFFALATSIYKDYKLEQHIDDFETRINELARLAGQKPGDVHYFASKEYRDRYAKESLNLLNPGEKLIVIPQEERNVIKGLPQGLSATQAPDMVLALPNRDQWWEYFFGKTLSINKKTLPPPVTEPPITQGG